MQSRAVKTTGTRANLTKKVRADEIIKMKTLIQYLIKGKLVNNNTIMRRHTSVRACNVCNLETKYPFIRKLRSI